MADLKLVVLRCLAYSHAKPVSAVVDVLGKARLVVAREEVEDALIELLELGKVAQMGEAWIRA